MVWNLKISNENCPFAIIWWCVRLSVLISKYFSFLFVLSRSSNLWRNGDVNVIYQKDVQIWGIGQFKYHRDWLRRFMYSALLRAFGKTNRKKSLCSLFKRFIWWVWALAFLYRLHAQRSNFTFTFHCCCRTIQSAFILSYYRWLFELMQ